MSNGPLVELKPFTGGNYDACYDSVGSGRRRSAAEFVRVLQQPDVTSGSRPDAGGSRAADEGILCERVRRRMRPELLRRIGQLPALPGSRVLLLPALPNSQEPGLPAAIGIGRSSGSWDRAIPLLHLQGPRLLLQGELVAITICRRHQGEAALAPPPQPPAPDRHRSGWFRNYTLNLITISSPSRMRWSLPTV